MKYLIVLMLVIGCGKSTDPYQDLSDQVDHLKSISDSLQSVINSDYSTCPPSGDTSDPLIRKICTVAQASTNEARVELKGELATFASQLQDQITAVNADLLSHQASIDSINASVTSMLSNIATLQAQMTSANSAITALQTLTASISTTLAGNMITFDIGSENVSAGPLYESILRRNDKQRFNGYVQAYGTAVSLASNSLTAVNGSATLTVALTAHGYIVGDIVNFSGLTGSRGFTSAQLYGDFVVQIVATNTFTITAVVNASSSGTLGGAAGIAQKMVGRGMGTLWSAGTVSDTAVRVSNLGSKRYNFIIRRIASDVSNNTGELCYSKTNNLATFATINAAPEGGNSAVACK